MVRRDANPSGSPPSAEIRRRVSLSGPQVLTG